MSESAQTEMGEIKSTTLVGYWRSRTDDLEIHITGLEGESVGTGSFKDIIGRVYHAGKLRNIQYQGGKRWTCESFRHVNILSYPTDPREIIWEDAVIEMINWNLITINGTSYDRK